ncbi:MAG: BREX-2 system phosphatase PglZ [Nannocystaceae bacterium]|nr:BREX-2 system phosphatase PglZ [bacterium]
MSQPIGPDQLRERIDKLFARERAKDRPIPRRLAALQGATDRQRVTTSAVGDVEVIPVRSELELRRYLPPLSDTAHTAFVLAWPARELPVDIAGRFVHHGRVDRFDKADQLRHLFGRARSYIDVDPDLTRSKLGRYLAEHYARGHFESTAGKITLDAAWAAWLKTDWGLDAGASLGLDTLMAWVATNTRGPRMLEMLESEPAAGVRDELEAFLRRRVGDAGPGILQCWLRGHGRLLMVFAALFEVLTLDPEGAPQGSIRSVAAVKLEIEDATLDALIDPVGKGAGAAFRVLRERLDAQSVDALLSEAQSLVHTSEHPGLTASRRLPVAWTLHLERIGQALRSGANAPSKATLGVVAEALKALETHEAFTHNEHKRLLERATMAARLLAWLVARPDQRREAGAQSYAEAQRLALWYAQEGGYVDWARRRARCGDGSTLLEGIQAVVEAADAVRVQMDRSFAKAYVDWLRAGRPTNPLLPIDAAVSTFGAPYLAAAEDRRMLVLLMDGMGWAQAVELLQLLETDNAPWRPIAWNTTAFSPGKDFFTPVLAQLPSETKVSRSAFFAGKPTASGVNRMKLDDAKLWADHKALAPFYSGTKAPKLRVKSNGFETNGSVSKPTRTLIQDRDEPVVAVVVNAIDDQLASSPQEERTWKVDDIVALRELLDAALVAGRTVLIGSDHGHVSGQRLQYTSNDSKGESGSRWRTWNDGDTVREYEVAVESSCAWAPKGSDVRGVIVLADDQHSYSSKRCYGEHGGATLAEVVTPTFVLGHEGLKQPKPGSAPDPALESRGARPPAWWHLEVETPPATLAPAARRKKSKDAVKEELGQTLLVETAAMKPPQPDTASSAADGPFISETTRKLVAKISKTELFKARAPDPKTSEQTVAALELLIERGNSVSSPAFARHLGTRAFQVGGLVSNVSAVVNIDGYDVIALDPVAKVVELNLALLKQGFGV